MQKASPLLRKEKLKKTGEPCDCHDAPTAPKKKLTYNALTTKEKNRFWKKRVE